MMLLYKVFRVALSEFGNCVHTRFLQQVSVFLAGLFLGRWGDHLML